MNSNLNIAQIVFDAAQEKGALPDATNGIAEQLKALHGVLGHDRAELLYSAVLTALDEAQRAGFVAGWTMRAAA
jgi:hypothetical protein